jgi:hypothetical protein
MIVRLVDSAMSPDEAKCTNLIQSCPQSILDSLEVVTVLYRAWPFRKGGVRQGQIVVHKCVADKVEARYRRMFDARFPIEQVVPICRYKWNDEASMRQNNTSAFNPRFILGTQKPSLHWLGLAIDDNPRINGAFSADGTIQPINAQYIPGFPGTKVLGSDLSQADKDDGWDLGLEWTEPFDTQHLQQFHWSAIPNEWRHHYDVSPLDLFL